MPGASLTEPTFATHPHATVGESCLSTIKSLMPFGSISSRTWTCCAAAVPAISSVSTVPR